MGYSFQETNSANKSLSNLDAQGNAKFTAKQDTLVSGENIKTINNISLLGSGDIQIGAGGTIVVDQSYNAASTYAQSGTAVAQAIATRASTALDNLSSDGQMIIDSANGTISNCILEIPQNIKLELSNNVLTLKAGSILTKSGNVYTTSTTVEDKTRDLSSLENGKYVIFSAFLGGAIQIPHLVSKILSGDTLPTISSSIEVFYLTTDKTFHLRRNTQEEFELDWPVAYPLCLIEMKDGVASFAKDDAGNDIIFNDYCIIGHHYVGYPNPKLALGCNGFDANGKLENSLIERNAVIITELPKTNVTYILRPNGTLFGGGWNPNTELPFLEVNTIPNGFVATCIYVKDENKVYRWSNGANAYQLQSQMIYYGYIKLSSDGFLQNLLIRQPYEGARYLLTDEIKEEVATKQADVTTLTGYDATKTQTLKNVSGVLTWVDD